MSAAAKASPYHHRLGLGNTIMIGRKLSGETKRKIGAASKGNTYAKGRTHSVSPEARAKISVRRKVYWEAQRLTVAA